MEDYTTFAGTAKLNGFRWSYIIGFPIDKIAKYTFTFQPDRIRITIFEALLSMLIIPIVVFIIMGYIFGRSLTNPVIQIIQGIQHLAKGKYDQEYSEKGLYKEVYHSLNNLAKILKANEIERQNVEKMREDWIHNLSHDLKTPLASIKGYGELMAEDDYHLTRAEIKEYSKILQEKAGYMEKLLDDLKLSQVLKNGLIPVNHKENDLVALLREIIIDVLNDPPYTKRIIHFDAKQEQIVFAFDKSLMQRAFTNLIYNALVHNDKDTEIIVTIKKEDRITVEVVDNGRGISQEDLAKLFERYYRGTNTGESHKGTGWSDPLMVYTLGTVKTPCFLSC